MGLSIIRNHRSELGVEHVAQAERRGEGAKFWSLS